MIKVLFICHGNICRSTMAESVMTHLIKQRGLSDCFYINSAATSREEIGNPPHYGTVRKLNSVGIPVIPHRAVQMTKADYDKYDYLIGMDSANIRNIHRIAGGDPEGKVYKLLSFANGTTPKAKSSNNALPNDTSPNNTPLDSNSAPDVADPWYTGDFDATYRDVLAGCQGLLEYLLKNGN